MARSASVALGEVGQQIRFCVHVLLLEYVSTFLLRLVPTSVSLVSSICSLSALFSSSRFPASLVSFGYLVFCLLFLPLTCVLFVFFIASLRSWNWLVTYKHAVINAVVSWVVDTRNPQLTCKNALINVVVSWVSGYLKSIVNLQNLL